MFIKNHIKFVEKGTKESLDKFAERLNSICSSIISEHKKSINPPPFVVLTSTRDGILIATIQFFTREDLS